MTKARLLEIQFLCLNLPGCTKTGWYVHWGRLRMFFVMAFVLSSVFTAHRWCVKEMNGSLNHSPVQIMLNGDSLRRCFSSILRHHILWHYNAW